MLRERYTGSVSSSGRSQCGSNLRTASLAAKSESTNETTHRAYDTDGSNGVCLSSGGSGLKFGSLGPTPLEEAPVSCDDQVFNPFTRVAIFAGHSNIVRFIADIDGQRFASGGDDHMIKVWDTFDGRNVASLDSHSRPLTCLTVHQSHPGFPMIISAASDKTICLWNGSTLELFHTLNAPSFTSRAVTFHSESTDVFYSAGEKLCMWNFKGALEQEFDRGKEEEDIHIIHLLSEFILVAAADRKITVYQTDGSRFKELQRLQSHKEKVTSLTHINEAYFASGSLDGAIVLWSSHKLTRVKFLSLKRRDFQASEFSYPYSIQYLTAIDDLYILCAMSSGFYIQDVRSDKYIAAVWNAHYSKILDVSFMFDDLIIATSSEDGRIRLWGCMNAIESAFKTTDADVSTDRPSRLQRFFGAQDFDNCSIQLLGECLAHCGSVYQCHPFGNDAFISCSADSMVLVWKDGVRQEMKHNETIRDLLYGASSDFIDVNL